MSGSREDVFDKIMRLPLFKKIEPFYKRHKEVLLYLFFGGVVTVVSIGLPAPFSESTRLFQM